MDSLVVGTQDCNISKIVDVLHSSPVIQHLYQKLPDLSRTLQVPHNEWETIRLKLLHEKIQNSEALVNLLESWKMRRSGDATLGALVRALRKHEMNEMADRLCTEFLVEGCPTPEGPSSCGVNESAHIRANLDTLIDLTTLNAMLLAKLETAKILHSTDVEELNCTPNKVDRNAKFWKLMQNIQPEQYRKLIVVMKEMCQDAVAQLLRQAFD